MARGRAKSSGGAEKGCRPSPDPSVGHASEMTGPNSGFALLESLPDAVFVSRDTITWCNGGSELLLGYSREELVGQGITSLITGDTRPLADPLAVSTSDEGPVISRSFATMRRKDGGSVDVELTTSQVANAELAEYVTVARPLQEGPPATDTSTAADATEALIDAMGDGLISMDTSGIIRRANRAFQDMTGYDKSELTGKSATDLMQLLVRSDERTDLAGLVRRALENDIESFVEFTLTTKDGREVPVAATASPVKGLQGEPTRIIATFRDMTEFKEAEEELRREKTFNEAMLASLPGNFYVYDSQMRLVRWNKRVEEATGYSAAELAATGPLDFFDEADRELVAARMRDVFAGGQSSVEANLVTKQGQRIPYHYTGAFARVNDETYLVGVGVDITERKRAEDALKASEERHRLLVENSHDAILVVQDGIIKFMNARTVDVIGHSSEDLASASIVDLIHPDDRQWVIEYHLARLEGREVPPTYAYRVVHKDGSERWVEINVAVIEWEGRPATLGFFSDITDRKRAAEELRQSECRFREMADLLPQMVYEIDLSGNFTFANRFLLEFTGYTQEDIDKGLNALELFVPEDRPRLADNIGRMVEGDPYTGREYTALRKDGSTAPVKAFASPIEHDGKVAGLRGIVFDLTEQKRAEEERHRIDEQLQLAGRLAAVGQLAAGVAHELNNPLTAVQGLAQLMAERDDLDDTLKEDLEGILREARRASRTTTNLLTFCRKHNPDKKLISLNEVVERSIELHAYRMKVNNVEVRLELDPDLPLTMGDFHQMQQVLVNLITNAEQAMTSAHGEGTLTIRSSTNDDVIRLEVEDSGPGIPEENLKRIFNPFFTTKTVGEGTGLGLGICYGIVDEHGGRLRVESEVGRGTTFVIDIPLVSSDRSAEQPTTPTPAQ